VPTAPAPGDAAGALGRRIGALLPAAALLVVVALPLAVIGWLALDGDPAWWAHLASTMLPEYALSTVLLCAGVGTLTLAIGTGAAWLVTVYRFPGRDVLEWALILPLAMPAYVLAYAYTDFLQFTGPVQTTLRELTGWGWQDYWFPPIHSRGGAVLVLSLALYPYVYVTARAAFLDQAACTTEVARTLGCGPWGAFWRVTLPAARPALVAGVTFVLMETLADFGAVRFFEVPTFTTGIYRAWYAMGSPGTAAQLALVLMSAVLALLVLERSSRGQASFAAPGMRKHAANTTRLRGAPALAALAATATPLLLGFVLPALLLVAMALGSSDAIALPRLLKLAGTTLALGGCAAVLILTVAVAALYAARRGGQVGRALVGAASLGYAMPGVVIGVALLVTLGTLDRGLAAIVPGLLVSGSIVALLYAYLVRFFAVAWNPLDAGMARIRGSLEDAARTLGCSPWRLLGRVHLPLLRPSLLGAALLVMVDVLKELPATLMLRPFNVDTLAVEAFLMATQERLDGAALPSLLIVVAGLAPVVLLCRMMAAHQAPTARAAAAAA
jgi:iron(III) transport system permease protein